METVIQEQGKVIGNVGMLDLRQATEESIRGIRQIGNVGAVLYSPETAPLLQRLKIGNVGATILASREARLLTGEVVFTQDMFSGLNSPLELIVSGRLFVYPGVRAEDIEKGVSQLVMSGQAIFPERLAGVMQSKLASMSGQTATYTADENTEVIAGNLVLDANRLRSLEDSSRLLVVGKLRLPEVLDDGMLAKKVAWIRVIDKVRCHEENLPVLLERLADKSVKITTIPEGYELVEQDLQLDNALLGSLPGRKLYCAGQVVLESDVEPGVLDKQLDALIVEDLLIAPARLRNTLANKVNLLTTRAVFYEGELWLVSGESNLSAARFEYLDGQATLVVSGELAVDPGVEPKLLAARLAKVHNLGEIQATYEQLAAISSRLGLADGELVATDQPGSGGEGVGNVGVLTL